MEVELGNIGAAVVAHSSCALQLIEGGLYVVQARLQMLLQMDRLREMDLLLAILLLQEIQLLPEIPLHLQVLLLLMHPRLQHLQQRQPLLQRMRPRRRHHL